MAKSSRRHASASVAENITEELKSQNNTTINSLHHESIEVLKNEFLNISKSFEAISRILSETCNLTKSVISLEASSVEPSNSNNIEKGQNKGTIY